MDDGVVGADSEDALGADRQWRPALPCRKLSEVAIDAERDELANETIKFLGLR